MSRLQVPSPCLYDDKVLSDFVGFNTWNEDEPRTMNMTRVIMGIAAAFWQLGEIYGTWVPHK